MAPSAPAQTPSDAGALDPQRVPVHVALVLDEGGQRPGGRDLSWADSHTTGGKALLDVIDGGLALGVRWLTVYALSTEDWRRPPEELHKVLAWYEEFLIDAEAELATRGVRLRAAGRRDQRIPERLRHVLDQSIERTSGNDRLTLTLALNYGGRAEIVDAIEALAAEGAGPDEVDEVAIGRHLYHPDMPDPDLVVRTSGDRRVSDLLLWEVAYSELVFVEASWPDLRRDDLYRAVEEYQRHDRRYGGLDPGDA